LSRYRNGQLREASPSRFLGEIGRDHYENLGGIGSRRIAAEPARAAVSGNFSRPAPAQRPSIPTDDFKPSPPEDIVPGVRVRHLKFGEGIVQSVEGARENRIATIRFSGDDIPERRLVLRFAKLMIV
jgi:DNA helicase-2/ATP-dependent DNA helicase PcrA